MLFARLESSRHLQFSSQRFHANRDNLVREHECINAYSGVERGGATGNRGRDNGGECKLRSYQVGTDRVTCLKDLPDRRPSGNLLRELSHLRLRVEFRCKTIRRWRGLPL